MFWQFSSRRLVYIGINASLSELGVGTYSGADWLKSTSLSVRKKQIKLSGDLREMVYKAASCSYMLKISKNRDVFEIQKHSLQIRSILRLYLNTK